MDTMRPGEGELDRFVSRGASSHPATQPSHGFHAALDSRRFRWSPQCAQAVENAQAPGVRLEKDERAIRRVVKAPG